jgi:hypothetical protein
MVHALRFMFSKFMFNVKKELNDLLILHITDAN